MITVDKSNATTIRHDSVIDWRVDRPKLGRSGPHLRSPTPAIHSCSKSGSKAQAALDTDTARFGTILPFQNDSSNGSSRRERALRGCATSIAGRQKMGQLRTGSFHTPNCEHERARYLSHDPGFADVSADGSHRRASPPGRREGWSPSCRASDAWPKPPVAPESAGDSLRVIRYTNWAGCGRAAPRGRALASRRGVIAEMLSERTLSVRRS